MKNDIVIIEAKYLHYDSLDPDVKAIPGKIIEKSIEKKFKVNSKIYSKDNYNYDYNAPVMYTVLGTNGVTYKCSKYPDDYYSHIILTKKQYYEMLKETKFRLLCRKRTYMKLILDTNNKVSKCNYRIRKVSKKGTK